MIGVVGNRKGWELRDVIGYLKRENITKDDVIVTGGAEGVDSFAIWYAKSIGVDVFIYHPRIDEGIPDRYFNRNKRIVIQVDRLIAFDLDVSWNKHSGTRYTIDYALDKIPVKLINKRYGD